LDDASERYGIAQEKAESQNFKAQAAKTHAPKPPQETAALQSLIYSLG
jgi:hypothetical protein